MSSTSKDISITKEKRSTNIKFKSKYLALVFILLPLVSYAQLQTTPILQDPMNNTVFSFYPFDPDWGYFNHKDYFHSLRNNIYNPETPDSPLGLWFRMMLPNGYDISDPTTKYPLILFLHGAGERGTENADQLLHGGQIHRDAVSSGEFPGILIYPQQNTAVGGWPGNGTNGLLDQAVDIVKKMIKYYNADPNRIYVHGLSGGGQGAWESLIYYPTLVAAAIPMSNAQAIFVDNESQRNGYSHIPIWLSQGGRDTNPMPTWGNYCVYVLRDNGISIRYSFMPTTGHGTWNTMYNKPDFFSWMLQYSKTSIHVFYEQSQFCQGEQIPGNLKLGITAGFDGYEWALNNTSNIIAVDVNEIIPTTYGDYFVRIKRGTDWSEWSDPKTIDSSREPSPSPIISSGLASLTLPALDGSTSVKLFEVDGPSTNYQWHRDNIELTNATNDNYTATLQGNYTLTTKLPAGSGLEYYDYWNSATQTPGSDGILDKYPTEFRAEPLGCESLPSNIIRVTTGNGPDSPLAPINFFVFSRGSNETELIWDDNSDNETGFEIYRSDDNGINYDLISIQPANVGSGSVSYSDIGLQASTEYCYRIRAVNGHGGSLYTDMTCASTIIDTTPPSPPLLVVTSQSPTSISLSWSGEDDVGVTEFEIYRNGLLIGTQSQNNYVDIDVISQAFYTYYIIAKDAAGNQSTSNQVVVQAITNGLAYKYYHFNSYLSSVDQIESSNLIREGIVDNFDISISDRGYRFGFVFEGFISIPTAGTYRFYSESDDGSRVLINGITAFNNDGPHSCSENGVSPAAIYLTPGFHSIKVLFFENGGGECLTVKWSGPGISKAPIPSSALSGSSDLPNGPNSPTNFLANAISYNQIDISWSDNSNDETGFEIYRSAVDQTAYELISVIGTDVESYSDHNLLSSTTYYYKILAKNNVGLSDFVFTSAQTQSAPPAPNTPLNLSATAVSTSEISLSWTDNSDNELGFEIFRATNDIESSYLLIATTAPNDDTFSDIGLPGGTTFYYKIRAKGSVNSSAYTMPVNTTTVNNPPVISTTILNRSMQIGTILEFEVNATDLDQNVVTFATDGVWPPFGTVTNIGQNKATVSFDSPSTADVYTLRLSATDGNDIVYSNFFTLTVGDNAAPVITSIGDQQLDEGKTLTVNISATDDSGNLVLSALNLPPFAAFNYSGSGGTASIDFNPVVGQAGFYSNIQIVANDGEGGITEEFFNLVVNAIETSYLLNITFDDVPRFNLPWNYVGGSDIRIIANDTWPIGNLYTSNLSSSPITIDAAEMDQEPNGISFSITYSFGNDGPGIQGYNELPDEVIKNGLAGRWGENNKLIINGLEDVLSYELNLMSSVRTDYGGDPWATTFRIDGVSKTIDPVGNATEFQRFVDVRPTNGTIEIEMLTSGGSRTMLNAFTLEAYYDDGTPPIAPTDLALEALSSNSILVKWKDNSSNETDFDVFRRSEGDEYFSLIGSVNKNIDSLLDESGIQGTTRYYYYVQARNKNGLSNSATLDVISLNALPIITQLNSFTVRTGQKTSIPVSASDYENDPITFFLINSPPFVSFVDYGDGTGIITLDPDESVVGQSFEMELQAKDLKNGISSIPVIFNVANGSYLQTIYLNLTQADVIESTQWNNLIDNPATTTNFGGILDIDGSSTSIGLVLSGTWTGHEAEGLIYPLTYLDEALFPQNVMKGFWYTEGIGNITFTGLNTDLKYNISLFSSNDASDSLENINALTQFNTGSISTSLDPFKNPNKIRKLSGLVPDGLGNISISIESIGDVKAVLNAVILESYSEEQRPFAPSNVVADIKTPPNTEVSNNPAPFYVELNWADNSGIESGFEIYRYDYESGVTSHIYTTNANEQTYTDLNLTRDKKIGYRVRAVGPTGVSEFTSITDVIIPAYRILLNINYDYDNVIASGWNNTNAAEPLTGFSVENLRDDFNNTTDIGFGILEREIGAAGSNYTGVNEAGLYPALATRSFFHIGNGQIHQFQWFGLDDALTYDLVFFASRIYGVGTIPMNGHTTYKVNQQTASLNAWYNKDKSVIIKNIKSNNGSIPFSAGQTFSDATRWNVGFMNVIELRAVSSKDMYPKQYFHYYAADNGDISTLANWFDNPDESGSNPSSFSEQGLTYVIRDEKVTNLANSLTIGGLGSKMILKDNIVINFTTGNLSLNLPSLEIDEGASVTFSGAGLSTATINIGDGGLVIRNGATLDIGDAEVLVSGLGSINPASSNGVISTNGGSIQILNTSLLDNNLYFSEGATLKSLKIDNSNLATLIVNDTIRITDKLEVTNGHLVTNGYIKLISDAANTAMIPMVGSTSTITGAIEYQRYWARSKGGYYYIGVPVQGQILADWQTDFYMQGLQGLYPTYWTNVYTYDESTNSWSAFDNITNAVEPGHGITALIFSSEFTDGFIRYSNTGNPIYGDFRVNLSYTERGDLPENQGWQLVANPYACAIDLNKIDWANDAPGLDGSVYIWNGATSIYDTWNPNLGSRAVASGQGFFVKADGTNPSPYIDFKEINKVTSNPAFLRTEKLSNLLTFKMINQDSVADNFYIAVNDVATFGFESLYDAFKYKNSSHNLYGMDIDGNKLAINSIPAFRAQDTLQLNVESSASKSYILQVTGLESLEQPVNIYLIDRFLNTTSLLNEGDRIPFAIDKNVNNSFGQRFSLVIGQPGVVKLKDAVVKAGKTFKVPLSLGQLENIAEMTVKVRFNTSEFKLNSVNSLNTFEGVIVDTTFVEEGIIILSKNDDTGIFSMPDVMEFVEFEFKPLVRKTGVYSIWIDPESSLITSESAKYSVLITDAKIDLRSSRKLKGNILDLKGRSFNNAIVRLNSDFDSRTANPVDGWYGFDIIDKVAYNVSVAAKDKDYSNPDLLDLIQMIRYVNGREKVSSNQILYSSDLNNDGQVNNADLTRLQMLILSRQNNYPARTIFSPSTEGSVASRQTVSINESSGALTFVADDDYMLDFLALRKGEVYQNSVSNKRQSGRDTGILFDLIPDNQNSNILHLSLYVEKEIDLSGLELHLSVENSDFEITGIENHADRSLFFDEFYNNTKNQLGLLWASLDELSNTISNEKPFLTLSLKRNSSSGSLSADIIEINNDSKIVSPEFQVNAIKGITSRNFNGNENSILTLYPNPTNGELNVVIYANNEDNFTFMFINANGQILFEETRHVYQGINTINFELLSNQHYLAPGYYLIRTKTPQWTDVKPFIIKH